MPSIKSIFIQVISYLNIMLKNVGAKTQHYFLPVVMGKGSDRSALNLSWPHWLPCSWLTICGKLWGQPSCFRINHCPVLAIKSKGFVRSKNSSINYLVLFSALFLELTEDEHHVHRASVGSDDTLALIEVLLGDGL